MVGLHNMLKIALISMRPYIGNKIKNLEKMKKFITNSNADFYIFGEMSLTGYRCKDNIRELAENIDGFSISFLKKLAKNKKCYIIFGMPRLDEKIKGIIYNSAILIHPNGRIDIYDKWFFPNFGPFEEKLFFDEGENINIINTKFGRIGLIICYDIFFPELCKAYTLQGADIIICISASPSITKKYFERIIPTRAIENTTFFFYSNLVGTQEDLTFWGGSQGYDPLGNLLIKAPYYKESIITFEIDINQVNIARSNRPVIRDIRPEIYHDLYNYSRKNNLLKKEKVL
jgi:predicted amidohydrolase